MVYFTYNQISSPFKCKNVVNVTFLLGNHKEKGIHVVEELEKSSECQRSHIDSDISCTEFFPQYYTL